MQQISVNKLMPLMHSISGVLDVQTLYYEEQMNLQWSRCHVQCRQRQAVAAQCDGSVHEPL